MALQTTINYLQFTGWTNYSSVSISFWFYVNTLNASTNRLLGSDNLWEVRVSGGLLRNELFQSAVASSTTTIVAETWYHCVATAVSGGSAEIYVNGVSEGTAASTGVPTGTTFAIGNRNGASTTESANSTFDDVRVYNRVLSADEVSTIYACRGTDGINEKLQHRWLFNEKPSNTVLTVASDVKDLMGHKNGSSLTTGGDNPVYRESRLKFRRRTNG